MESKSDQRCACDPDIDVARCRGSLGGSHSTIIAGR
jgi:hypothetical protein